jgi:inward rectifier potassium channel
MKVVHIGGKGSLFHDLYYKVIKLSWTRFFIYAAILNIALNFVLASSYLLLGAKIENARPGSLWDAFMFSFQTSTTIGYGHFLPGNSIAHQLVVIDTLSGIFFAAIVTGLAFAKFARPRAKIIFSDKIILTTFDGKPALMFRLANARDNHIVDASLNVASLLPYTSSEGHELRRFYKLKLSPNSNPTFTLSWTAIHIIDESSPLHGLSFEDFSKENLVIFVSSTGIDGVLSQMVHANYRYTSKEIIKAKKFVDILDYDGQFTYKVNLNQFHDIAYES